MLLSLGFHLLAGGAAPVASTVGWLTAATAVAALPLTRRPLWPARLVALLAVAQVVLHLTFHTTAHHGHGHGPPLPMVATHALATVLTALVLRYGQALLRAGLSRVVRHPLPPRAFPVLARTAVAASRPVPPTAPATGAASGRAPPLPVHS
ncbi:hypothetical protein SAMN05216184_103128 [Georgenia satyanarayanai]|uniref:Uncharacterized protein n=1 Tax=Georgenia satyanarayanai TaxID=860221 RepID=A0A2Y9A7K5_9MICO|nr:hypothetical protein A8987_103128 [Georgenia satyanarayanai]SSA39946.1 hypothetical protein SAMN05216184_103128 [Georgenia satyanarayanai]